MPLHGADGRASCHDGGGSGMGLAGFVAVVLSRESGAQALDREYTFLCDSEQERDTWVKSLRAVGERWAQ
eukprot:1918752-Rhodomonas_salina.1